MKDNFIFFILGPKDTIYEGAYFKIHCHIPDKYPFVPPMMSFMTKVWHPNISSVVRALPLFQFLDGSHLFGYSEGQVDARHEHGDGAALDPGSFDGGRAN